MFNRSGINPNSNKIMAIKNAPVPSNIKQLQAFIGLCNFYSRFIPNFAKNMSSFYSLLQKNAKFQWNEVHQKSFDKIKELFVQSNILQHFNLNYETCLETDSSSYGLGAVLLQRKSKSFPWLPVQFASRSLNPAEKNYSQIEREGLSVIFGTDKFRNFILGTKFIIFNDHKPLHTLFSKHKAVPQSCSARVLRWALKLSQYDYEFVYSRGCDNIQSDFLSRLPLSQSVPESEPFELIFAIDSVNEELLTHELVRQHTESNQDLIQLKKFIKYGCPHRITNLNLSKMKSNIPHMTIMRGCVMYRDRVYLPPSLQMIVLNKLHEDHSGIVAIKSLARELIWFPGMDNKIEELVKSCQVCQSLRSRPPQNSHVSWPIPDRPWSRIHIDHFFL